MTSKSLVTLPKELRKRLGIQTGSRIRFNIPGSGPVQIERVLYELEDRGRMTDEAGKPGPVMSFKEMNEAKARMHW